MIKGDVSEIITPPIFIPDTAKVDDIITVALTIHESETEFLNYYNGMTVELPWE